MIEPNCYRRRCKYFWGIYQPDDSEDFETINCEAFPEGIPDDIAYGENKHSKATNDQLNDIVYERAEE